MPGLPDFLSMDIVLVIPGMMLAAAVFLAIQTVLGVVTEAQAQRIVNRRLQFRDRFKSTSEAMVELRKSRGLDASGNFAQTLRWFNMLVVRSGVKFDPLRFAGMALAAGLAAGAAYAIFVGGLLSAIGVGVAVTLGGPIVVLHHFASKRMKAMSRQLPDALQIVCRSLEAGHPVATAVALVAREMPDPVGTEFGMAADEVSYGMSLTNAVLRMAERVGDPDVELFAATVRLQEKTGGNLTELLKANTSTIRERQTMRLKVKAASSEGRVSAMILTSAPFVVMAAIHVLQPGFYGGVMHEPLIRYGFAGLLVWMIIGNIVMNKMINFKM